MIGPVSIPNQPSDRTACNFYASVNGLLMTMRGLEMMVTEQDEYLLYGVHIALSKEHLQYAYSLAKTIPSTL